MVLSRIATRLCSPSPGGGGSTRVQRAAGWGESLSLRAVSEARLSPHPVEHLAMLADPPPPGEGKKQPALPKFIMLYRSPPHPDLAANLGHRPVGAEEGPDLGARAIRHF